MSLVSTVVTGIQGRLGGGITISTTSDPTLAAVLQWLNETALWLTGLCAENDSDLGRTIGTVTTLYPAITAASKANPCAITAASHGFVSTDEILVRSVSGMTELNDTEFTFTKTSDDAGTLGIDSSDYTTYSSGGYASKRKYSTLATSVYTTAQTGWIVDGTSRNELTLITEDRLIEYSPVEASEPQEFYVDGENNICFPIYPDAVYVVKIPYWRMPTALTATTDTMPFLGLFDNVFIEAVTWRAQNRDEYDVSNELKWQSFLLERARRVIEMRKKMSVSVSK